MTPRCRVGRKKNSNRPSAFEGEGVKSRRPSLRGVEASCHADKITHQREDRDKHRSAVEKKNVCSETITRIPPQNGDGKKGRETAQTKIPASLSLKGESKEATRRKTYERGRIRHKKYTEPKRRREQEARPADPSRWQAGLITRHRRPRKRAKRHEKRAKKSVKVCKTSEHSTSPSQNER